MKSKNVKIKNKKIVIKNKKKFIRCVVIFCLVLLLIFLTSAFSNKEIVINNDTNMSNININKHSKEVKLYYEGLMNDFVIEYNDVQNLVWTYIYNNVSNDKNIEKLIDEVNTIFSSNDWSTIGLKKNAKWRGSYRIDKSTNALIFKFENKDIEPTWVEDNSISYMIEKN